MIILCVCVCAYVDFFFSRWSLAVRSSLNKERYSGACKRGGRKRNYSCTRFFLFCFLQRRREGKGPFVPLRVPLLLLIQRCFVIRNVFWHSLFSVSTFIVSILHTSLLLDNAVRLLLSLLFYFFVCSRVRLWFLFFLSCRCTALPLLYSLSFVCFPSTPTDGSATSHIRHLSFGCCVLCCRCIWSFLSTRWGS